MTFPADPTVKSIPDWRMALEYVSPSIPTHADAEYEPEPPDGFDGVGTLKRPDAEAKVEPEGGYSGQQSIKRILKGGISYGGNHSSCPVSRVLDMCRINPRKRSDSLTWRRLKRVRQVREARPIMSSGSASKTLFKT